MSHKVLIADKNGNPVDEVMDPETARVVEELRRIVSKVVFNDTWHLPGFVYIADEDGNVVGHTPPITMPGLDAVINTGCKFEARVTTKCKERKL